jgi:hypothetical protein
MRSPKVWITATPPGVNSRPVTVCKNFTRVCTDDGTEIPVLLLETILMLSQKRLEIMKKHPVKHCEFRMTLSVDPFHGRGVYS